MNLAVLKHYVALFQTEVQIIQAVMREKGTQRFARPMVIGLMMIILAYAGIYAPPAKKMAALQRRIFQAKRTAEFADSYTGMRDKLFSVYAIMPPVKDRESWLTGALVETMKSETIIADSIGTPEEDERSGLVFQRVTVSAELGFSQLMSWLRSIEAKKPLLHVSTIELTKRSQPLGHNGVNLNISTVVPIKRLGQ